MDIDRVYLKSSKVYSWSLGDINSKFFKIDSVSLTGAPQKEVFFLIIVNSCPLTMPSI